VRITSAEWKGGRWRDDVALASLALFAHGIAFVVLSIALGRRGTPLPLSPRVASRVQPEQLRFVAPASPAPALRHGSIGGDRAPRRSTADIPGGAAMQPLTDTGASFTAAAAPSASSPAGGATAGALANPLSVDPRLLVAPGSANNVVDTRPRTANAAIASGVRAFNDSLARARRRWTVGVDTTHRFGIANCGIVVDVICIPFGFGSMPTPGSPIGGDPRRTANEAEVRAAIARIRARNSPSSDGAPERAGP
jgi:hypothetical protein